MNCKFCNQELPEKGCFCPVCGRNQHDAVEEAKNAELEEVCAEVNEIGPDSERLALEEELETAMEEPNEERIEEPEKETSKELKKAKRIALITGCVALLAILGTVLFMGIQGGWDISTWFDWKIFRDNDINYKDSYTVSDEKAENKRQTVVATLGDAQLTNGQLQIYYWSEVYNFISNYYYYLSYFGLDYTAPLDEQMMDETQTWQQYFLESALQTWQANQALYNQAKAAGYQLSEEDRQTLDTMLSELEASALEDGYASADEMVQESFGAGCTAEDYVDYMEVYYYAYAYFESLYVQIDPTDAEIDEYFTANQETLASSGITKDDGNYVDVRHILVDIDTYVIEIEEGTEEGTETTAEEGTAGGEETEGEEETEDGYTDEEWAACYAAAQDILNLWLENPTEDYFIELVGEYTEDGGSSTTGGLYTDITAESNYVENFLNWCMDENRQVGDCEIVQTEYGYHIMYFVGSEPIWYAECRDAIISEGAQQIVNDALDAETPDINYKKIALAALSF